MPTFGKVDEYKADENWRNYVERLNHFFEANEIRCEGDPKEKSYVDLAKLVQYHYKPKLSVIVERFKFNTRSQQ